MEGFQWINLKEQGVKPAELIDLTPSNSMFAQAFKRRSDVGPMKEATTEYVADKRYYSGYTDVQGIGAMNDYCRMVFPAGGKESSIFFACARIV